MGPRRSRFIEFDKTFDCYPILLNASQPSVTDDYARFYFKYTFFDDCDDRFTFDYDLARW